MSVPKPSGDFGQVVSINSVKHELPLDQLINSMVKTSRVQLPYGNYECTKIFHQAGNDTLRDITPDGKAYFETFRRSADFNNGFIERIKALGRDMVLKADNDTKMGFVTSAPAPFPN